MNLSKECLVMREWFGIEPLCRELCGKYLSHCKGGCLIAHTLLSLIEYNTIERKVVGPISSLAIRSLLRRVNNQFNYTKNDVKYLLSNIMKLIILVHDIGKLSRRYCHNKEFRHEIISFIYGSIIIEKWASRHNTRLRELYKKLNLGAQASIAILLHHESLYWRILEESISIDISVIITRRALRMLSSKYAYAEDEDVELFINAIIKNLAGYGLIGTDLISILRELPLINKEIIDNTGKIYDLLSILKGNIFSYKLVLPMYYILFIVDNRAASARDLYWRKSFRKALKFTRNYNEFINSLSKLTKEHTLHVSISILPSMTRTFEDFDG